MAELSASYERLRAAHLHALRAALEDHVARVDWPRERIDRYRTERLRGLLAYAKERSPFHAGRMADLDPSSATVDDLVRVEPMTKQDAQDEWDAIVTAPELSRSEAERILATERWFSYTPAGEQIFSSGGSSGVRGVYVWDWNAFVSFAMPRLADAGARGPPRTGSDRASPAGGAGGRRPTAREHSAVRRAAQTSTSRRS